MSVWSKVSNGWISYVVIVVAIVVAGYMVLTRGFGTSGPQYVDVYFYDIEAKELVPVPGNAISPVVMPDGSTVVRAQTFESHTSGDENGVFIAYLEKFSDDAHAVLTKYPIGTKVPLGEAGPLQRADMMLVATIEMAENDEWVPRETRRGQQIVALGNSDKVTGESLRPILPGK
ncbi:MAG: hypothetical protein AAGB29_02170 [Planctomycetota bacterium]